MDNYFTISILGILGVDCEVKSSSENFIIRKKDEFFFIKKRRLPFLTSKGKTTYLAKYDNTYFVFTSIPVSRFDIFVPNKQRVNAIVTKIEEYDTLELLVEMFNEDEEDEQEVWF
jgi:hypothetical protein